MSIGDRILASKRAPSDSTKALWRALAYLRPHWRVAVCALVALLFVSAANLIAPQLIRRAIDVGIAQKQRDAVLIAVIGLIAVAMGRGLFTFFQGYLAERASQAVAFDLRDALFARIQRLSFSYYDHVPTGQLMTRLTNDVEQIRGFVGRGVIQLVAAFIMLTGSVILLLAMNWRLTIVSLAALLPAYFLLLRFVRQVGPIYMQMQRALGQLTTVLQEDLAGVRVIRAFGREEHEIRRYREINEALLDRNVEVAKVVSNKIPFVYYVANFSIVAVIWYGGAETVAGRLTIGELIAFNSYVSFLLSPILAIGFLSASISRAGISSARVFELLDAPLEVRDADNAKPLSPISGRVEFENVHFRYPGSAREILQGVSFTIEPGQTVAILGATGSGKSTIINLLPRFYDVNSGRVLIDHQDVREVTLESLRSQIGIVLQETLLFKGTVRDNIAYGKPDATQEEIEQVALAAQAHDFITALPRGYETIVGERGMGLSGGQRQRIAIARALLINPRLLILDDSASAVDAQTDAAIKKALDILMRDNQRTAFVIAQRISTVRDVDVILVLDKGRIVAQGDHETLLRDCPLYSEILGSQISASPEAPGIIPDQQQINSRVGMV